MMIRTVRALLTGLGRDQKGNVATIFAVVLIPLLLAIGMAVDYLRAQRVQNLVQAALDAAVIATARSSASDNDDKIAHGEAVFHANFDGKIGGASASPNIVIGDGIVTATADLDVDTTIMELIGVEEVGVSGYSEVSIPGLGEAEVVLVLDYSGSMSGSKFDSMIVAAANLIRLISDDMANNDVLVGLVPFSQEVYVTLPGEHVIVGTAGTPWTNCTAGRRYPYVTQDTTPVTSDDDTKWGETIGGSSSDDDDDDGGGGPYDHCGDYASRNMQVHPMTNDHQAVIDQLETSSPYSNTNIAVGLEFGYHLISPNAPFSQGTAYGSAPKKVVILLSDGVHNQPGWGPGDSYNVTQGSNNIDRLCTQMKNDGIMMVTVAYELDDADTRAQLEACASETHFYIETSAQNLAALFNELGNSLAKNLYLSR
jgi:Flp pilus assembly protein TadG